MFSINEFINVTIMIPYLQELLRFLFREAKIHNAILFFDECECLFESRNSRPNPGLGVLLTEVRVLIYCTCV